MDFLFMFPMSNARKNETLIVCILKYHVKYNVKYYDGDRQPHGLEHHVVCRTARTVVQVDNVKK